MSSLHDHNFKDLPTDWRHDGPLSAKNDEKHLPPAMRAAGEIIATIRYTYGGRLYPESKIAEIIDREAVKPATAELLMVLQTVVQNLKFMRAQFGHLLITMDSQAIDIGIDRAESAIAKHEGRT